jgi:hypothetical protein
MNRRSKQAAVCAAVVGSLAVLAGCTIDFDHFVADADATAADAASGADATARDGALLDGGTEASRSDGSLVDAGSVSCPVSNCLGQAGACGTTCGQQDQACARLCTTQICTQNCTSAQQSCLGRCASTCITCEQDAGCSAAGACFDASRP